VYFDVITVVVTAVRSLKRCTPLEFPPLNIIVIVNKKIEFL
jgi:hypothetical protein